MTVVKCSFFSCKYTSINILTYINMNEYASNWHFRNTLFLNLSFDQSIRTVSKLGEYKIEVEVKDDPFNQTVGQTYPQAKQTDQQLHFLFYL